MPISAVKRGELGKIVNLSYAALVEEDPEQWSSEKNKWDDFDKQAFDNPETVGKCVFVTRDDNEIVGVASYDPRNGEVGQNCVLPQFRGKGYGQKQIKEILRRLKSMGLTKTIVTTSEHPFFASVQAMYEKAGFTEIRRRPGGPDPRYKLIDYEKYL